MSFVVVVIEVTYVYSSICKYTLGFIDSPKIMPKLCVNRQQTLDYRHNGFVCTGKRPYTESPMGHRTFFINKRFAMSFCLHNIYPGYAICVVRCLLFVCAALLSCTFLYCMYETL